MVSPRSDSIPNEANCPVHLEILALLLRSDDATKQAVIRVHLRGLAFQITALCELADLRTIAGAKGDLLYSQATEQGLFEDGEGGPRRHKGVTLARTARG